MAFNPEAKARVLTDRLHQMYDAHDEVIVGFSGGKDSTLMLEIAVRCGRERGIVPKVWHYDQELIGTWHIEFLERTAERTDIDFSWFCAPWPLQDVWSSDAGYWMGWEAGRPDLWSRPKPDNCIPEWPDWFTDEHPNDAEVSITKAYAKHILPRTLAAVIGTRAEENLVRRSWKHQLTDGFYFPPRLPEHTFTRCHLIYDVKATELWHMTRHFGWDWNRQYLAKWRAGVSKTRLRVGPILGEESSYGIPTLQREDPELWARAVRRVPQCVEIARYGQSALVGRGNAKKQDGLITADFIIKCAERLPEPRRSHTLSSMRRYCHDVIATHGQVDLLSLLKIAQRGDTKASRMFMRMRLESYVKQNTEGRYIRGGTLSDAGRLEKHLKHAIKHQQAGK